MRRSQFCWMAVVLLVAGGLWAAPVWSAESGSAPEANPPVSQPQQAPGVAELRAEIHGVLADLWQEQAKPQPDREKIAQLQNRLVELRSRLWTTLREAGQNVPPGQAGIGGAGPGAGWGVAGGQGRGQGWGPQARGKGPRWGVPGPQAAPPQGTPPQVPPCLGFGPRAAFGPGFGPGGGPGMGPGGGMGRGFGPGMGQGRGGPWFVDRNQNGICDHWEAARGLR